MVAKPFAVIAGERHHRRIAQPTSADRLEHPCDLRISEGHFPVIRIASSFGLKLRWRFVWRVRIVQVHPEKERCRTLLHPWHCRVDHVTARTFGFEARTEIRVPDNAVIERVEAIGEPKTTIE